MGSPIKINSISIDFAGAANETDMVKCNHFSIRGFVEEMRERDERKCWPFSAESFSLVDQGSYSLPPLTVPNSRWWRCMSCIKDINADGTKDCGHSKSRNINSEKQLDGSSSVIASTSRYNSVTVIDHDKENNTDIAVEENVDVNCERSQKDDQTATTSVKKVHHPRSMDASTVRSKSRKHAIPEQVGNKRAKEKVNKPPSVDHQAFGSGEIAGVVDDTPPKAITNHKGSRAHMECDNLSSESISELPSKKTRKVRLLSELLGSANTNTSGGSNVSKEDQSAALKRDSVRGRKRKSDESNYASRILSTMGATSENASKSCDSDSESTDRDPIKGKQRNRRFQVVDEFLPSQEGINENDNADPAGKNALSNPTQSLVNGKDSVTCPLNTQRTEKKKLGLVKKKKNKPVIDNNVKSGSTLISFGTGMDEGNQVKQPSGPSINAISQSTRDLLDSSLASEGYFRKSIPQLNDKRPVISLHMQDNDHVRRSRDAEANCIRDFGSSSKSNTGEWLRTGVDFSSSNTNRSSFSNFKLRHTSSSTEVADLSCVLQKDASGADRKGKTVIAQEQHEAPRSQSPDRNENTAEEQNDEIMEIVELLAKNQYERCLPDEEEEVSNKETAHKSKKALLIDLNETYDNGISMEEINTSSRQPQQPCGGSNARKEEHFSMGTQHKPHDFFPITQPYVPSSSPFGMFPPPNQENRGSSSIRFSGHNSQWLGNVPSMGNQNQSPSPFRVLRACNTCQSVPEASRPVWPPPGYQKPVSFNMDQSTRPGMLSSNENTWNLNFVSANGKQKTGSTSEFSFGCKHAAGANSSRSIDAFSSESSIPALHLLSLMDPRLRSTTPADHHGNAKFTRRHFPPASQSIELQTGDSSKKTPFSTQQLPFDLYSKRFTAPETSRKSFPPLGASSLSFQKAQASWNHHQEKKNKRKDTFPPVYTSHEKPVFASSSNNQGRFQLLGASNSMRLPLKFHMTDKEKKQKRKPESCNNNASVWPPSGPIVCSVNRNPADFTIAEPGNVYMLTGENLKVRKRASFKRKPSLCKQDALKQTKKPVCPVTENA